MSELTRREISLTLKLLSPLLLDFVIQGNSVLDELGRGVQLAKERPRSRIFKQDP